MRPPRENPKTSWQMKLFLLGILVAGEVTTVVGRVLEPARKLKRKILNDKEPTS